MAKITPPAQAAKPAAAAESPKPANSAAPGTADAAASAKKGKAKKEKAKRELYPALWDAANETRLKLSEIPADFDPKKHKPLKRADFEKESLFFELKARKCEEQAKKFREMGAEADRLGGSSEGKKLKRLASMKKRYEELIGQLKEAGMSDEEITQALAAVKPAEEKKEEKKAE